MRQYHLSQRALLEEFDATPELEATALL